MTVPISNIAFACSPGKPPPPSRIGLCTRPSAARVDGPILEGGGGSPGEHAKAMVEIGTVIRGHRHLNRCGGAHNDIWD